jgi:hypothetical protein
MATTQYHNIQRQVSNAIQKHIEQEVDRSISPGRAAGGAEMNYANMTLWEQEKAIQHMANKVPFNYAYLLANPCARLCSMSNEAITTAVQQRLLLPVGEDWKYCQCNRDVGPFLSHCYRCPENVVRNPIRNSLHKELKARFSDILKARIATANLNRRVLDGEPRLDDYFERLDPDPPDQSSNETLRPSFEARGFENGVKVRADMAVQMTDQGNALVIDFTFVEPTARTHVGTYNKAGQAALKGRERKLKGEYKHWKVHGVNVTTKFHIIAVETFGVMLKEDITSVFGQFIHAKENTAHVLHLVTQQLSVAIHTIRSIQFHAMKDAQVFQERRIVPAANRSRTSSTIYRSAEV